MTYAWARDFVLQLVNQYSVAGEEVQASYNNQADYIARIPKLLDSAQTLLATTVRKIRVTVPLTELFYTTEGAWKVYALPENCWQMMGGGLIRIRGDRIQRFHKYRMLGAKQIAVPATIKDPMMLEYFRRPGLLGDNPEDGAELDNEPEVQMALPYYAAAHLVMQDNAFAYSALMNEFEDRKNHLFELPQTDLTTVEDVYGAMEWGDGQ